MNISKLILALTFVCSLIIVSCGEDDVCTTCTQTVGLGDCIIEVCEDGTSANSQINCIEANLLISDSNTRDENVSILVGQGFTCE